MALDLEFKTYQDKLPDLLGHEGKFVVIKGAEVIGVFESYDDALNAGYTRFDSEAFLVKKIQAVEPVQFVGRA